MDFSETIKVCDIKVGGCSQLNYMKLYEYQRSRSFIDLGPNHSDSIFISPPIERGRGHIVFGADPVGVGVSVCVGATLSCLHDIS